MKMKVKGLFDKSDNEIEVAARWVICHECSGNGSHAHHIDGDGLTQEDLHEWEPEEIETYISGGYDKRCTPCGGSGKVLRPDLDRLDDATKKLIEDHERSEAAYRAECEAERRAGC